MSQPQVSERAQHSRLVQAGSGRGGRWGERCGAGRAATTPSQAERVSRRGERRQGNVEAKPTSESETPLTERQCHKPVWSHTRLTPQPQTYIFSETHRSYRLQVHLYFFPDTHARTSVIISFSQTTPYSPHPLYICSCVLTHCMCAYTHHVPSPQENKTL